MMDKATYLLELERLLHDLSAPDRQNALAYYNEFLQDAEAEGQMDASAVLGNPHTLAAQIKADIAMDSLRGADATMPDAMPADGATGEVPLDVTPGGAPPFGAPVGMPVTPGGMPGGMPGGAAGGVPGGAPSGMPNGAPGGIPVTPGGMPSGVPGGMPVGAPVGVPPQGQSRKSGLGVVWTIVLAILAIPIGVPLAIAVIAVIFAVLVALVALLFSFVVVVVALLASGVLASVIGFILLFSHFATGLFYLGAGLALLGLCLLVGFGFWKLGGLCVKGVAKLFNVIRKKLAKRERSAQ
jgi:uncharacterized membrane protein